MTNCYYLLRKSVKMKMTFGGTTSIIELWLIFGKIVCFSKKCDSKFYLMQLLSSLYSDYIFYFLNIPVNDLYQNCTQLMFYAMIYKNNAKHLLNSYFGKF